MKKPNEARAIAAKEYERAMRGQSNELSCLYDFMQGWDAAIAHLLKSAPEFDERAALGEAQVNGGNDSYERNWWIEGARWQHTQMAAQRQATHHAWVDAQTLLNRSEAELARLRLERDRYKAALERTRAFLAQGAKCAIDTRESIVALVSAALNFQPAQQEVRMSPQETLDPVERELLLRVIRQCSEALLMLQSQVPRPSPAAKEFDKALKMLKEAKAYYGEYLGAQNSD